jgi:carboxypeptidase Q
MHHMHHMHHMHFMHPIHRLIQQFAASLAIFACLSAPALAARGPSTPEEHARVVALAAAANQDPLTVMTSADGRWFEKWAEDIPDFMFGPDRGAYWFMTTAAKGDLKRVLRFQHTVSVAAYQVRHQITDPRKNRAEHEAVTLAGVEGLLRAYESLVAKRAENRSPQLDAALAARDKGTLAAFVLALPPMPE